MNLLNLVHDSRHRPHRSSPRPYPSRQHTPPPTRGRQPYHRDMASALVSNPYSSQLPVHQTHSYSAKPPPSPPDEDPNSKCTLPSIQSLIVMADGSPTSSTPHAVEAGAQQTGNDQKRGRSQHSPEVSKRLPPSPPTRLDSGFDGPHQSMSVDSAHSSYVANAINNVEPYHQRQSGPTSVMEPYPMHRHPSQSPYTNSPYASSPTAMSFSYPSPAHPPISSGPGAYYSRPPTSYPAPELTSPMAPSMSSSHPLSPADQANPWQHHHYISPSSSAAFAGQSQDRYICPTCQKAFSRPSSLRIHSHSHTGEKPFKCQHVGCGKAFSVRSNMKRHERGCHPSTIGSPGSS